MVRAAVAIELEIMCPIRLHNLSEIATELPLEEQQQLTEHMVQQAAKPEGAALRPFVRLLKLIQSADMRKLNKVMQALSV